MANLVNGVYVASFYRKVEKKSDYKASGYKKRNIRKAAAVKSNNVVRAVNKCDVNINEKNVNLENNDVILNDVNKGKGKVHLIHWYFQNRKELKLLRIESFHIKMLKYYYKNYLPDLIVFSVALDKSDNSVKKFITDTVESNFNNKNVKIIITNNDRNLGEFVTLKLIPDFIDYNNILYTHFKGVTGKYGPKMSADQLFMNEAFWCYLMYEGMFSMQGFQEMTNAMNTGKGMYGVTLLNNDDNTIKWLNKFLQEKSSYYKKFTKRNPHHYFYSGTFYCINSDIMKQNIDNNIKELFKSLESIKSVHIGEFIIPNIFDKTQLSCYHEYEKSLFFKKCYHVFDLRKELPNNEKITQEFKNAIN